MMMNLFKYLNLVQMYKNHHSREHELRFFIRILPINGEKEFVKWNSLHDCTIFATFVGKNLS